MRRDKTLEELSTIRRDLAALLKDGAGGELPDASVSTAISRIDKLEADIRRSRHYWLYDVAEPIARFLKVILQMAIGVTAVALICRMALLAWHDGKSNNLPEIKTTLTVIAAALAIAAAVELAYTLFTPGPDEAVDPLLLGLAAALSLQLSEAEKLNPSQGLATFAYAAGLGLLFAVRKRYVNDDAQPPTIRERLCQASVALRKLREC